VYEYIVIGTENFGKEGKFHPRIDHEGQEEE